jgi:hypothetical protein
MRITTSSESWGVVCRHLLPEPAGSEHAAFLFGNFEPKHCLIRVTDYELLAPGDFIVQEIDYLELTDATRARLIKRAHDIGACLIEMHSHPGHAAAVFSVSDFIGLRETVPHMLWRLRGQPYAAIIVANSGFDGLAWYPGTIAPVGLEGVAIGSRMLVPTNLSVRRWR